MQLTITLTSTKYQINKDIMVNSEQKICETLQILKEAGQINIAVGDEDKLRSMRTGMFVSKEFTYKWVDYDILRKAKIHKKWKGEIEYE